MAKVSASAAAASIETSRHAIRVIGFTSWIDALS